MPKIQIPDQEITLQVDGNTPSLGSLPHLVRPYVVLIHFNLQVMAVHSHPSILLLLLEEYWTRKVRNDVRSNALTPQVG